MMTRPLVAIGNRPQLTGAAETAVTVETKDADLTLLLENVRETETS